MWLKKICRENRVDGEIGFMGNGREEREGKMKNDREEKFLNLSRLDSRLLT